MLIVELVTSDSWDLFLHPLIRLSRAPEIYGMGVCLINSELHAVYGTDQCIVTANSAQFTANSTLICVA